MSTTWMEQCRHDASLRAFVDAEIARACVRLASLEVEHQHALDVIEAQKRQIAELEQKPGRKGKTA